MGRNGDAAIAATLRREGSDNELERFALTEER